MSVLRGTHDPVDPLRQLAQEGEKGLRNKVLRDVVLPAGNGATEVSHGLGRPFIGAVVLGVSEPTVVTALLPSHSSDASKRLPLHRNVDHEITVTIMVLF